MLAIVDCYRLRLEELSADVRPVARLVETEHDEKQLRVLAEKARRQKRRIIRRLRLRDCLPAAGIAFENWLCVFSPCVLFATNALRLLANAVCGLAGNPYNSHSANLLTTYFA